MHLSIRISIFCVLLFMTMYGHIISALFLAQLILLQMRVFLPAGIPLPCRVKGMGKNCTLLRVWVRVMGKLGGTGKGMGWLHLHPYPAGAIPTFLVPPPSILVLGHLPLGPSHTSLEANHVPN